MALRTAYSQSKPSQINPSPLICPPPPPHQVCSLLPLHPHLNHSPASIFTKVYHQPQHHPLLQFTTLQFIYHWTATGEGVTQGKQRIFRPTLLFEFNQFTQVFWSTPIFLSRARSVNWQGLNCGCGKTGERDC